MAAADIQALIRFLAQDAKVPLAQAVGSVKQLQQANIADVNALAKSKLEAIQAIFPDEKIAKQVFNAAKRVSKKRAAGDDTTSSPRKKKDTSIFSLPKEETQESIEASLALPDSDATIEQLYGIKLYSNRAPIVLAMTVQLLKYTMPEQPLSSRLSLAQGYVGTTSRARAVSLGIESGKSADEEGFGEGQPITSIMGKELRVLKRADYERKKVKAEIKQEEASTDNANHNEFVDESDEKPALWALDLEALKKSTHGSQSTARSQSTSTTNMPIYTPQSARAYLLKSFSSPVDAAAKKLSSAQIEKQKEDNLGHLLRAIDLLYESWLDSVGPDGIETRVWSWYVKARPAVESGVAGWGGKNTWKLADLLSSRKDTRNTLDSFVKKEPQE